MWNVSDLWKDSEFASQVVQPHVRHVVTVNDDGSPGRLDQPEEGQRQWRLSRTRPSHDPNLYKCHKKYFYI